MPTTDPTLASAVELLRRFRARRLSPLELMQATLARIDAVNPRVNAMVTLDRDGALREARRATAALRRGAALPPLHGLPVGIKDVTPTRGLRTTYGSTLFADHVPDQDALVVARLRAAGAIVVGKTNTPEFAFGPNTVNRVFGATPRPPSRPGCARSPRARISAARCAAPRRSAASSASVPHPASFPAGRRCWPGTPTPSRGRWRGRSPMSR
jgi:amidase